jgi:branched-chain amino acid transport system ATP-binding protein
MLQIEGLHTHYGAAHILHGVTMLVEAGTSVGLLGRNGMGKTTLIRSLMGYVKPTEGRIQWNDREVTAARRSASRASASATCRKAAACSRTCRCARTS